jgi:hypothetical protein
VYRKYHYQQPNTIQRKKYEDRLQQLETTLESLKTQIKTNEENQEKKQQTNKEEMNKLVQRTIENEIPKHLNTNFSSMTNQLNDLNSKFDMLMNRLEPSPEKQDTEIEGHNNTGTTTPMDTIATNERIENPNKTPTKTQCDTQPAKQSTPKTKVTTTYATPINQWNTVAPKRRTQKETPISREKQTVKESSVKEKLREEKARQEKKIANKKSIDPMETTTEPQL